MLRVGTSLAYLLPRVLLPFHFEFALVGPIVPRSTRVIRHAMHTRLIGAQLKLTRGGRGSQRHRPLLKQETMCEWCRWSPSGRTRQLVKRLCNWRDSLSRQSKRKRVSNTRTVSRSNCPLITRIITSRAWLFCSLVYVVRLCTLQSN